MSAVILWAWDDDNDTFVKVKTDSQGRLYTVAVIDELDDIGDVYVPSPTDEYFLYWDAPNSRWACRALVAADMAAHKNTHDPIDGSDKLDTAAPVKVGSANAIGSSHSLPRADHVHEREHAKYTDAEAVDAIEADDNLPLAAITFIIDGGGSAITTGEKGHLRIPFACTISQVTMLADQEGSIKVDIWKQTYAAFPPTNTETICGANEPEISSGIKDEDATLTAWTTAIAAGDILAFNVDSITTIERVTINLKVVKT